MKKVLILFAALLLIFMISCRAGGEENNEVKDLIKESENLDHNDQEEGDMEQDEAEIKIEVTSPQFKEGEFIPSKFTCEGENINPELVLKDVPEKTASLVIIFDDPDAPVGLWVHWIVYDIPGDINEIPENWQIFIDEDTNIKTGKNSWGKNEYGGPCPPTGDPHRYFFKIYALDIKLNLGDGKTKEEIEEAMQEHIIAEGQLMGRYKR